jgi:hypothetical protein
MNNFVRIDLTGVKTEDQVLNKLGEVFEFGGPDGNIHVLAINAGKGWGKNWDALNDSLMYLDSGGIWGISKRFHFPLTVILENTSEIQKHDRESFETLKDIFSKVVEKYNSHNMKMIVEFKS